MQNASTAEADKAEEQGGDAQQKKEAVVKDITHFQEVAFAVAAPHDDLGTCAEPETQHEDGNIEYAAQGRSSQLHLSHTPQKRGVRHAHELLHQYADEYGVGYFPNLSVAVMLHCFLKRGLWRRGMVCEVTQFNPYVQLRQRKSPAEVLGGALVCA